MEWTPNPSLLNTWYLPLAKTSPIPTGWWPPGAYRDMFSSDTAGEEAIDDAALCVIVRGVWPHRKMFLTRRDARVSPFRNRDNFREMGFEATIAWRMRAPNLRNYEETRRLVTAGGIPCG